MLERICELEGDGSYLVEAITLATDSQNPVDLRELKAIDQRQMDLAISIEILGCAYRAEREGRTVATNEFTSAVVAESVLAIWRERPHQARLRRREHLGAFCDEIFSPGLNGSQAVIAALLLGKAGTRRKRRPRNAPVFLRYGSRFKGMLMGGYLLSLMEISLDRLDHRNFQEARDLVERESEN
ncbi:MAG: AIPR family protein [Albidovulum sp.]|nr:AIPR family protein [Albidovulum sp.]